MDLEGEAFPAELDIHSEADATRVDFGKDQPVAEPELSREEHVEEAAPILAEDSTRVDEQPAPKPKTEEEDATAKTPEELEAEAMAAEEAAQSKAAAPPRIYIRGLQEGDQPKVAMATRLAKDEKIPFDEAWKRVNGSSASSARTAETEQPKPEEVEAARLAAEPEVVKTARAQLADVAAQIAEEIGDSGTVILTPELLSLQKKEAALERKIEIELFKAQTNAEREAEARANAEAAEYDGQFDATFKAKVAEFPDAEVEGSPLQETCADIKAAAESGDVRYRDFFDANGQPKPDWGSRVIEAAAKRLNLKPKGTSSQSATHATTETQLTQVSTAKPKATVGGRTVIQTALNEQQKTQQFTERLRAAKSDEDVGSILDDGLYEKQGFTGFVMK